MPAVRISSNHDADADANTNADSESYELQLQEQGQGQTHISNMDRLKRLFKTDPEPAYERIRHGRADDDDEQDEQADRAEIEDDDADAAEDESHADDPNSGSQFSWIDYSIFLLLGAAMLWAWNMFLAAAPYFQYRFRTNAWILNHFQAAEISAATIGNLGTMIILTKRQRGASYLKRISASLILNTLIFAVLAVSTKIGIGGSATFYFVFLLVAMLTSSIATALIQNGLFSFALGFGRSEYTQAIMTGQAVAGVLPSLAQIVSVAVMAGKNQNDEDAGNQVLASALLYFLTATAISVLALLAFWYLLKRRVLVVDQEDPRQQEDQQEDQQDKASVPLTTLFIKLRFLALAVFLCFAITMVFPVFTASIQSVSGRVDPAIFIPLAFLVWNTGDLFGRLSTLIPAISLIHHPFALFCLAMARLVFIPLYLLCNIKGRGAVVPSDFFYLAVVQFLFGLTNGYLGSECMMGAGQWVAADEREAAGGFMSLLLVGGLTAGSLMSFLLGDV